eukprot:2192539-Rhodomonas_salina.1
MHESCPGMPMGCAVHTGPACPEAPNANDVVLAAPPSLPGFATWSRPGSAATGTGTGTSGPGRASSSSSWRPGPGRSAASARDYAARGRSPAGQGQGQQGLSGWPREPASSPRHA